MRTRQQLEVFVREEIGLSDDEVSFYGPLTETTTWQNAVDEYLRSLIQERTHFLPKNWV